MRFVFFTTTLVALLSTQDMQCISSTESITQYQTKKTLAECDLGEIEYATLESTFQSGVHALFFEALEHTSLENLPLNGTCGESVSEEKIASILLKLQAAMNYVCGKYPKTPIANLCRAWSEFHFSKEEKASLEYFDMLQHPSQLLSLTPLELKLSEMFHKSTRWKKRIQQYPEHFSPFYLKHGPHLIDLYTHTQLLQALTPDADSTLFHHVETYKALLRKKATFDYNNILLHEWSNNSMKLINNGELEAKKLIEPLIRKLDRCCMPSTRLYPTAVGFEEKN